LRGPPSCRTSSIKIRYCCGRCAFFPLPGCAPTALAQSPRTAPPDRPRIVKPIDPNALVTLAGNTRPEANAENDLGKLPDAFALDHMFLQLQRSPEREEALHDFMDQQYDSRSPNFHKWLTAAEFGRLYGSASEDIDRVCAWLRAGGFAVNTVYPSGMSIDFSGTAGQVSAAFHTEVHRLSVNGQPHIANMSDPRIPEALAPVLTGIVSLNDFRPHAMMKPRIKPSPQYTVNGDGYTYQLVTPRRSGYDLRFEPGFCAIHRPGTDDCGAGRHHAFQYHGLE
jgi:hypothetical protein